MQHWLDHWSGGDGGFIYDLLSGLLPYSDSLLQSAGVLAILAGLWHHHNCHQPKCWRITRHTITDADGTTHGACRKHRQHVLDRVRSI